MPAGRPVDPNSLRQMKLRERGKTAEKKTLPPKYTGPVPAWPLEQSWPRLLELWAIYWKKPQAHIWAALGNEFEVAIHVLTVAECEVPGVVPSRRALLMVQMNSLLLTSASLAKAGHRIADGDLDEEKQQVARTTSRGPGSRGRLRAVPPIQEGNAVE